MTDAQDAPEVVEEVTVEVPRKETITEHRARRAEAKARAAVTVKANAKAAAAAKRKAQAKEPADPGAAAFQKRAKEIEAQQAEARKAREASKTEDSK